VQVALLLTIHLYQHGRASLLAATNTDRFAITSKIQSDSRVGRIYIFMQELMWRCRSCISRNRSRLFSSVCVLKPPSSRPIQPTHRITLSVCRLEPTGTHYYQHRYPRKLRKPVQSHGFDFVCAKYRRVLSVHVYYITTLIGFKCRSEVEGEAGVFRHECEGEAVVTLTNEKVFHPPTTENVREFQQSSK
jgi:hypothetical protein